MLEVAPFVVPVPGPEVAPGLPLAQVSAPQHSVHPIVRGQVDIVTRVGHSRLLTGLTGPNLCGIVNKSWLTATASLQASIGGWNGDQ